MASPTAVALLGLAGSRRRARFDRDYANAKRSTVLACLRRALADPTDQRDGSFIRWAEPRYRERWAGADLGGDEVEAVRAKDLADTIKATRESRVPIRSAICSPVCGAYTVGRSPDA